MTGFLAKLGTSLAERWLALLVLPGVLWAAAAAAAYRVGQADPFDPRPLVDWLGDIAAQPTAHRTTWLAVAAVVSVLASAGAGLAAGGLGTVLENLWAAPGTRPPLAWIVHARQRRWTAVRESARRRIAEANDPSRTGAALARAQAAARRAQRRRLAGQSQLPQRPTRTAERFHASASRAGTLYGLDLNMAWPRLWSVLPDALRADVTAARDSYASAARLAGWGLMYAVLAIVWWPAVLLGSIMVVVAAARARTAANVLADLIDTASDLHLVDLAGRLGIPAATLSALEIGRAITQRLTRPQHAAVPVPAFDETP
ncbi:hypothetical protein [Streptomyces sp. NBC_01296]|uniref:hypothetical protein n=1 Tax=Streptomyces sp. NBC_01296 TaxID=2903816 RepID=UPI002E0E4912|nr:hypothetical protein OG299_00470 [Streptomyces sp. NBC_01296]